jgi:murein DD-endopeptidase MepM/ murein hydrolase activator NlpD
MPPTPVRPDTYVVQPGDSLNYIAGKLGLGAFQIQAENQISNPDFLAVGQILSIPTPIEQPASPQVKLIPNSELVLSPSSALFDLEAEVARWNGALNTYSETVEATEISGVEIVDLVSRRYSVHPRLLLAVLEYQSGWLTRSEVSAQSYTYQIGFYGYGFEGLFGQLSWAADTLNRGYYLWRAGWAGPFVFADGSHVPPGPGINAATAAIQFFFSQLYPIDQWRQVVGESGFAELNRILFGNPFDFTIEPVVPSHLTQPELQLPFEAGKTWSFTGGPHSAWGNWSAWAALDFAPPGDVLGCVVSNEWIVAASDGLVTHSEYGRVVQDLDADGYEETGWVLVYLHVESRDRVAANTYLKAGDRIGHPSCEGGVASGTHLHMARKYNGEWISADRSIPFELDGWVSVGSDYPYEGTLTRGDSSVESCACRFPQNQISR